MSGTYYIVNTSTLRVADIYKAKTTLDTPVVAQHKNILPETLNQQWSVQIKNSELTSGLTIVTLRALGPAFYAVPQNDHVGVANLDATWYIETVIPGFGGQGAFRIGQTPNGPYWTAQTKDTQGIKLQPNDYSENQLWTLIPVITPGTPLPSGGP